MSVQRPATSSARYTLRQLALPRAAARVLAASARSRELCADLALRDDLAEQLFDSLGGDYATFSSSELRCAAFRTLVVDLVARDFFDRTPGALGVGVWPLLGTRAHRLGDVPWVDVDAPQIASLRRQLLPPRRRWLQLSACLCNSSCADAAFAAVKRRRLLVLDESVLPLGTETLMHFLDDVSRRAPAGSEVVIAFDARTPLRPAAPGQRCSALELLASSATGPTLVRYPRLRFFDPELYPEDVRSGLAGVNAVAGLQQGFGSAAIAHLKLV